MLASEPIAVPHTATRCTWRMFSIAGISGRGSGGKERLPHQIVYERAQLEAALLGDQVDAVREEDDLHAALEVDPQAGAGEAGVPDRALRELRARGRLALGRRVPAERPIALRCDLLPAEELARDLDREERA